MSLFLGTHAARLDAKGRTSVPASFRATMRAGSDATSPTLILRPSHIHNCIEAWPLAIFETLATPLEKLDLFSEDSDDMTTALYANACAVEADKEGRIVLPDSLAKRVGLTDSVVFMGLGRYFQLWEPKAAAERSEVAEKSARKRGVTLPGRSA